MSLIAAVVGVVAVLATGANLWWLIVPALFAALALAVTQQAGLWALIWVGAGMNHELTARAGDPLLRSAHGQAMVDRLSRALDDDDADEVIVVSHCSGGRLAISLLARALRTTAGRPVSFLSLAPPTSALMGAFPDAHWYRDDLRTVASDHRVEWVDVTSPLDASNASLVDPVRAAFGPDAPGGARTFNAWFKETHTPERYRRMKKDRYRTHFGFLDVPDRPDGWNLDLFDMLLGPEPALSRYGRDEETGPFYAAEKFASWRPASSSENANPRAPSASRAGRVA